MSIQELNILSVWQQPGGDQLRGKRGRAFWRGGDGYSVALDIENGRYYDHRDSKGGGALDLVMTAMGCERGVALTWLEQNCGLDSRKALPAGERQRNQHAREEAKYFGIAALALADEMLERFNGSDLRREIYTRLRGVIRAGGAGLVEEFRAWSESYPELAAGMVHAGRESNARAQRRVAAFVMEGVANAA